MSHFSLSMETSLAIMTLLDRVAVNIREVYHLGILVVVVT